MRKLTLTLAAALLVLLASSAPAAADPVTALTTVFTGLGASAGVASLLGTVSSIALSIGLNYAAQAVFGHPAATPPAFALKLEMQAGGTVPRSFLFGEGAMTAGSLIYHGATAAGGNTPNAFYVREIALADLPGPALTGIVADGATVTWDPEADPAPDDFGIAIPEYNRNGVDHLWVTFSDGSQTTPDPFLRAWFGDDPDYPYSEDMIGRGVAKVRIVARVSQELFPANPTFKWICDGIPLYDLREDTTAGGSGAQRWDEQGTWERRSDPATVIYNLTRGLFYEGTWFYGGQNLAAALIPYAEAAAAANECDADMPLAAGGSEKRFRVAGEIQVSTRPVEAIEALLRSADGRMAEIGGVYKYVLGGPGAPVLAFTDDDIVVTEEQEFDQFPDLDGTINGIAARYPEPTEGFELKDAPPLYDTSLEEADGDRRLVSSVTYDFVTSATRVQRLMLAALNEARRFGRHNQVMPPSAYELEPLDVVAWTSPRNGYDGKAFRIDAATDGDTCDQGWAITEIDPADHDFDPETDEQPVSTGTLAVQRPPAQPIVGWAAEGALVTHDNGQRTAGARLEWDAGVDDVAGVRFQIRLTATTALVLDATTSAFEAGEAVTTQNLASITQYQARGKYLPRSARDTEWSDWLDFTTPDARLTEAELSSKVQAFLQQLDTSRQAALGPVIDELKARVAQLGQTTAGLVALLNQRIDGSIVNYIGEANAAITEVRSIADGLADLFIEVFAGDAVQSGEALFRMTAGTGPGGSGVSIKFLARALAADILKEAGIEIYAYADAAGGDSGTILRGDKVLIQPPSGDPLNALLITVQDTPVDAPIEVEGGDNVIRADLTGRQQRHKTVMDGDAEMRVPLGLVPMDYTHDVERDGGGHGLTFSDEFLPPQPSGLSELDGAVNQLFISVKSVNPPRLFARYEGSYSDTPLLAFRDAIGAVAATTTTSNQLPLDLSGLDFQPGSLLVVFCYEVTRRLAGGSFTFTTDTVLADWTSIAAFSAIGYRRVRGVWKIADGTEASVQPLTWSGNGSSMHAAIAYVAVAFDLLGGAATLFSPAADERETNAALAEQTIAAAAEGVPLVAMSFGAEINDEADVSQMDFTFSETADQDETVLDAVGGAPGITARLKIKRFTASPADVTAERGASGGGGGAFGHALLSCGFKLV